MTVARRTFFGLCADAFRALGRQSLVIPKAFDRLADYCAERAR